MPGIGRCALPFSFAAPLPGGTRSAPLKMQQPKIRLQASERRGIFEIRWKRVSKQVSNRRWRELDMTHAHFEPSS